MPKLTDEDRAELKAKIRRILVRFPRASKYKIGSTLGIDPNTALKLRREVRGENVERLNDKIDKEIAMIESSFDEVEEEAWRIISQPDSTRKALVGALGIIIKSKKELFNMKMDGGIFKRHLGEGTINLTDVFKAIRKTKDDEDGKKLDK